MANLYHINMINNSENRYKYTTTFDSFHSSALPWVHVQSKCRFHYEIHKRRHKGQLTNYKFNVILVYKRRHHLYKKVRSGLKRVGVSTPTLIKNFAVVYQEVSIFYKVEMNWEHIDIHHLDIYTQKVYIIIYE